MLNCGDRLGTSMVFYKFCAVFTYVDLHSTYWELLFYFSSEMFHFFFNIREKTHHLHSNILALFSKIVEKT